MNRILKKIFLFSYLILISNFINSQGQSEIDSLKSILNDTETDSVKADLFNKLSYLLLFSCKDTSEIYARHAMSLSKEINYQRGHANALVNIGRVFNIEGNFNLATDNFLKAMVIFRNIADSTGIANTYYSLAMTHYYLKNPENSLEYSKFALSISKKMKENKIEDIYNLIGLAFSLLNNTDSSLFYFENSVIIATEKNNKRAMINSYGNIANIYLYNQNYEKALEIYNIIEKISKETGNKIGLAIAFANSSIVYSELAEKSKNETEKKKFYTLSVMNAEKALLISKEINSLTHMNYAYFQLTFSYKGLKDYKKAFEYAEKYINATDSLYNINKVKEVEILENKYNSEQQRIKIESITKEKELKESIIKKQDQIIIIVISAIFLTILLLVFLFVLYRNKNKANVLLNEKNDAIRSQRSEIAGQRDKLSELAFELKKTNKTKNKFFSILAHDLKNPFQSILGFSELLLNQSNKDDYSNTEKYAKLIFDTTKNTYVLLENLLNWARVQRGVIKYQPSKFNLSEIITDCIEIIDSAAHSKAISITTDVDPVIKVYIDRYMFSTIIRNLISNALKFTERGGNITIKSEEVENGKINISVIDTGIGIKEENLSRIFKLDHSSSTKGTENETGTGLGLLVCKEFAEKNKGELSVKSTVGKGSTFILTVPSNIYS